MKTVLLTTETTHHLYYAWRLAEVFPLSGILLETDVARASFETFHPFETQREDYERATLLDGCPVKFDELNETCRIPSLNTPETVATLRRLAADVILVFGTGKLSPAVFQSPSVACLNLHGGNPQSYRGLDSHLWAIYHRDFVNLMTTLHLVDSQLDTGEIVFQTQLALTKEAHLYQLRSINTRACVELSTLALSVLDSSGRLPRHSQIERGRYYSFMPAVLKEDCVRKFNLHTARL